jgi:hypothetical protein
MSELDVVNFTNIDSQDYEGMWDGATTIIKAGETKQFPKFLAEHYCKHLINKILIRNGQDWSNIILREPLLKKILGEIAIPVESVEIKEETKPTPPIEQTEPGELAKTPGELAKTEEVFAEAPKEEKPKPKKRGKKSKVKLN